MDKNSSQKKIALMVSAEDKTGSMPLSSASSRHAFLAFKLTALSTIQGNISDAVLLLSRLTLPAEMPGVDFALELRYIARPRGHTDRDMEHRAGARQNDIAHRTSHVPTGNSGAIPGYTGAPVECFLLVRYSDWRFPVRAFTRYARVHAAELEKLLRHTLPGYRFTPVSDRGKLAGALRPFRIKDTGEVRRRAAITRLATPLAAPFAGIPHIDSILEMMQAQPEPTMLSVTVAPAPSVSPSLTQRWQEERGAAFRLSDNDVATPGQLFTEAPSTVGELYEANLELQALRRQAQHVAALDQSAFRLRVQISGAGPLPHSLVVTAAGEIGGVGKLTADAVFADATLPQAGGALWVRPRSSRTVAMAGRQIEAMSTASAGAPKRVTEQEVALNNLCNLTFEPWGDPLAGDHDADNLVYLASLEEAAHLFALPRAATWLPRSNVALNLPYVAAAGGGTEAVREANSELRLGLSPQGGGSVSPVELSLGTREHHMWVVGQTGTGKSTLLEFSILQDIYADRGVIVIDPHGDLIDAVLGKIPPQRMQDVVHFDPADTLFPIGINPLDARGEAAQALVVSSFLGLLKKMYDPHQHGIVGPRFEHAARNGLLTVMSRPGSTLVELVRVMTDSGFMREMLRYVKDPVVERYWTDQIANTNDFHKSEVLDWIVSKFGHFVTDPTIRRIIGQRHSGFSFREAMDTGKIVLISLAKGRVGSENASFLGLVLLPMILQAALSRVDIPHGQRRPVFLYVDEFQNYATDSLAQMLAEARKYRLALTLANQHIGQLSSDVRDAVIGNVGSVLSFRLGMADALIMEQVLAPSPVEAYHLNSLPNFTAYGRVLNGGLRSNTFTLATQQPALTHDAAVAAQVSQMSRRKYGCHKEKVDYDLNERARLVRR